MSFIGTRRTHWAWWLGRRLPRKWWRHGGAELTACGGVSMTATGSGVHNSSDEVLQELEGEDVTPQHGNEDGKGPTPCSLTGLRRQRGDHGVATLRRLVGGAAGRVSCFGDGGSLLTCRREGRGEGEAGRRLS
jgi:hypothetical protein